MEIFCSFEAEEKFLYLVLEEKKLNHALTATQRVRGNTVGKLPCWTDWMKHYRFLALFFYSSLSTKRCQMS